MEGRANPNSNFDDGQRLSVVMTQAERTFLVKIEDSRAHVRVEVDVNCPGVQNRLVEKARLCVEEARFGSFISQLPLCIIDWPLPFPLNWIFESIFHNGVELTVQAPWL